MPVFAPGASLAASFCRHHRDTEPGEIQIAIKCGVARCDRVLFAFVNRRYSFSDSSRDFALDSTWNWQRRAASAVIDPLPAAAGATAAAGKGLLARLAGCGGISRKASRGFLLGTAFPLGDSRASSIVVGSSTIGNVQKIFVGCVPRSGTSAGWPQRNSVFPVLIVVLASRFAEGLAVVLTA